MTENINPSPIGNLPLIDKNSPMGLFATAEFNHNVGYDIREVMRDEWWKVAEIDGRPGVVLSADGMRAMAPFAPRANAAEVVEQIIAQVREQR